MEESRDGPAPITIIGLLTDFSIKEPKQEFIFKAELLSGLFTIERKIE